MLLCLWLVRNIISLQIFSLKVYSSKQQVTGLTKFSISWQHFWDFLMFTINTQNVWVSFRCLVGIWLKIDTDSPLGFSYYGFHLWEGIHDYDSSLQHIAVCNRASASLLSSALRLLSWDPTTTTFLNNFSIDSWQFVMSFTFS